MSKQTKNIITRQYIQNELRTKIKNDTFALLIMWGIVILFILFISFIMLLDTPSLWETTLVMMFVFVPLIIICLIPSLTFLKERKNILAGKFEIAKIPLSYKEERAVHGYRRRYDYVEVLVFRDFKAFPVEHTTYELATNGDEYYIVYYKNSSSIKLAYSTKMYEYRE